MTVKSGLLEILEKQKGETLSGEKLAEELHCTRAAIWKAVKSLREEGYKIEAGQNKGYMLAKANDRLSVEAIRPFLLSPEVYIGVYQEVDSTNRAAKAAAVNGEAGHGSFVLAGSQSAGRGRRGRSFYSPQDAGIYLSVILEPKGSIQESLLLTAEAAVAVYKAVKKVTGISLDIKWVNDLYHNGRKVCGILTEAVTDFESGNIEFAVVGIGLNLFEASDGYPDALQEIAGGIYESREAAAGLDRSRLAAEIVNTLLINSERVVATMAQTQEVIDRQNEYIANTEQSVESVMKEIEISIEYIRNIGQSMKKLENARAEIIQRIDAMSEIAQSNVSGTSQTSMALQAMEESFKNIETSTENLRNTADMLVQNIGHFTM